MKLKSFCTAMENINKMKRQLSEWEKIFANPIQEILLLMILIISIFCIWELDDLLKFIYNPQINTHRAFPGHLQTYTEWLVAKETQSSQLRSKKAKGLPSFFSSHSRDYQRMKTVGGSVEWFKKLQLWGQLNEVWIPTVGGLVLGQPQTSYLTLLNKIFLFWNKEKRSYRKDLRL